MTRDGGPTRPPPPRATTDRRQAQLAEPHRRRHTQARIDAMPGAVSTPGRPRRTCGASGDLPLAALLPLEAPERRNPTRDIAAREA